MCLLDACQFEEIPRGIFGWKALESFRMSSNPLGESDLRDYETAKLWYLGNYNTLERDGVAYLKMKMREKCATTFPREVEGFPPGSDWAKFNVDIEVMIKDIVKRLMA